MNQAIDLYHGLDTRLLFERPRLIGLCTRLTGNRDIAEDLAQETLSEACLLINSSLKQMEKPRMLPEVV
ncbi:MAG TPA: hypothetical protein VFN35_17545 [Ktedonobacteraceae bacterium]|nr:hypothetical protein [Ktedonobacteraceae bacterium]